MQQQSDIKTIYIYEMQFIKFRNPTGGYDPYIPYYNLCFVLYDNTTNQMSDLYVLGSESHPIKYEYDRPSSLLFYRNYNSRVFNDDGIRVLPVSSAEGEEDAGEEGVDMSNFGMSEPGIYIGENGIESDDVDLKKITDTLTSILTERLILLVETHANDSERLIDLTANEYYNATVEHLSESLSRTASTNVSRANSQSAFAFAPPDPREIQQHIKQQIEQQIPKYDVVKMAHENYAGIDENVFGLGAEVIDFTFTKAFFRSIDPHEILRKNNRFGILKFACANGIPINHTKDKIYYFMQELFWMMEGDTGSAKGSTRQIRFTALKKCLESPKAIELFNKIYNLMCNKGDHIKICAVGGNVIRAFFLALETSADPKLIELSKYLSAGFNLDFLCSKASDADFTGFELMSKEEFEKYGPAFETALHLLVHENRVCSGNIEFPLIRLKLKVPADATTFQDCGQILDKSQTLKDAKYFYPQLNWFPQLIDESVDCADFQSGYEPKQSGITIDQLYEINKLNCVMQKSKRLNAKLTTGVANIIAGENTNQDKYDNLMWFVNACCKGFCNVIDDGVDKTSIFDNIESIVANITPLACEALIKIMTIEDMFDELTEIWEKINPDSLSQPTLDKYGEPDYSNCINIARSSDGTHKWSKSTSIAIGNTNLPPQISEVNKSCSKKIREELFSDYHLSTKFSITINTLSFDSSKQLSQEDLTDGELAGSEMREGHHIEHSSSSASTASGNVFGFGGKSKSRSIKKIFRKGRSHNYLHTCKYKNQKKTRKYKYRKSINKKRNRK
jgi:hypothetical protein